MIDAVVYKNAQGDIQGFQIKGHANYSEAGSDIVCSAVSAIIYTALGGMDELAGFKSFQQKDGLIKCFVPGNLTRDQQATTQIILKTMDIGLRQVEADYDKYVRVRYEEV
jgi:uncharacterized protein YsxB (DUF464 family)